MKCIYCGEVLANNDHATRHAGECPAMNSEPAWWVLWVKSAQHGVQLTAFGARLAWLFFGFILLLAMVLTIIGGN